ncbi:MAG: hypothetical protein COT15_03695, partial [Candidatus Diapherotrites archaeon CG08_land_8_20_14_0_20_34_12]
MLAAPFFALFLKERCRRVHGRSANPANHFFFFLERKRKSSCTKRKRTFAALKKKEKLNKNLSVKKESEENPIKTL